MTTKKTKSPTKKSNGIKPVVSGRKLFVELFLKYEEGLNEVTIKRTRREGTKNITDGEFWWKICREYAKKVSLR